MYAAGAKLPQLPLCATSCTSCRPSVTGKPGLTCRGDSHIWLAGGAATTAGASRCTCMEPQHDVEHASAAAADTCAMVLYPCMTDAWGSHCCTNIMAPSATLGASLHAGDTLHMSSVWHNTFELQHPALHPYAASVCRWTAKRLQLLCMQVPTI